VAQFGMFCIFAMEMKFLGACSSFTCHRVSVLSDLAMIPYDHHENLLALARFSQFAFGQIPRR
jgi:hypothetical protein